MFKNQVLLQAKTKIGISHLIFPHTQYPLYETRFLLFFTSLEAFRKFLFPELQNFVLLC